MHNNKKYRIIIGLLIFIFGLSLQYKFTLLAQTKSVNKQNPIQGKQSPKSKNKGKRKNKKKAKPKTFRVDFREKDIHDFLKAMSKIIGKNIIADDKVKGKITVISPKPIPQERAFAYLTSVLAVKGYGVVIEDKLLRVITLKDAVAKGRLIHIGKRPLKKDWVRENIVVTAIVALDHAEPVRLAGILKRVTNKETEIVEYKENDILIITGGALEVDRIIKIINRVDKPEKEEKVVKEFEDIRIIRLKNMEANKVEQTLKKITLPDNNTKDPKNKKGKKIDVVAHEESNSLIYVGNDKDWKRVQKIIEEIDIDREQVLLEVLIAEVSQDASNSFGIDWRYNSGNAGIYQFSSGVTAGALASAGAQETQNNSAQQNLETAFNSILGFSLGFLSEGGDILGIVNANINRENFLILSAPQLLTLNNQEAEINVGQDVPIQTAQRTSGGGSQEVTIDQFDYRPTGVKLKVTPQINSDQEITLKLFQEVKEAIDSGALFQPRFTKREIKTTVKVKNQQTIVIGGLISTRRTKSERKIPLLGDIPLIGYFFKRTTTSLDKTNLLVFITPHVLTGRDIADRVTQELKKEQQKSFKLDRN